MTTNRKRLPNQQALTKRRHTGRAMLRTYLDVMDEGGRVGDADVQVDALTDLLHAIDGSGGDVEDTLRTATNHFTEERAGRES